VKANVLSLIPLIFAGMCIAYADYSSLLERSPFCTRTSVIIESKGSSNDEFELHGICLFQNEPMFSIFHRTANRRYWLKIGENSSGIFLKKYDWDRQMIELKLSDGSSKSLKLTKIEHKWQPAQIERITGDAMPIPDEARQKFLNIVREKQK
jgi:hypothetical protein